MPKNKVENLKALTPLFAMMLIAILSMIAMMQRINGINLALSIGAIAGLGGYSIKELLEWLKVK